MSGYTTRQLTVRLGEHNYAIRALSDLQQFADPHNNAERAGISSAHWSLFGQVWPSGRVLAEAMCTYAVEGKRILELGCGLGLASIVLQYRHADVVASDHHPLAELFLRRNAEQNELQAILYRDLPWDTPDLTLGLFDLIIGSDILYEQHNTALLAQMVQRHAKPSAAVLITDPGRGNSNRFSRALIAQGFTVTEQRSRFNDTDTAPFKGRLLSYRR